MVAVSPAPDCAANSGTRRWTPDDTDHLIFQWVKLKGHSQDWVATQLKISQSTVSRVIQRYERWQAHAKERAEGRLDPSERLRAQRWLTFERNEALLTSCLRIANEMEGFTDVSKSTIHRGASLTDELDVRTQHSTIDRSGIASRFLRLAFRINMEQLKLAELDPPPLAEPLTEDQLAAELLEAAADAAELARWCGDGSRHTPCAVDPPEAEASPSASRVHERSEMHHRADDELEGNRHTPCAVDLPQAEVEASSVHERSEIHHDPGSQAPAWEPSTPRLPPRPSPSEGGPSRSCVTKEDPDHELCGPQPTVHNVHNLHNGDLPKIAATADAPCSCHTQTPAKKNSPACITTTDSSPPLDLRITPDRPVPYDVTFSGGAGVSPAGAAETAAPQTRAETPAILSTDH